jgi:hypothetical protein
LGIHFLRSFYKYCHPKDSEKYFKSKTYAISESDVKQERSQAAADVDDHGTSPYATYAQIVKVLHGYTSLVTRPMSVAVLNCLPNINLTLGLQASSSGQEVNLDVLFDTYNGVRLESQTQLLSFDLRLVNNTYLQSLGSKHTGSPLVKIEGSAVF